MYVVATHDWGRGTAASVASGPIQGRAGCSSSLPALWLNRQNPRADFYVFSFFSFLFPRQYSCPYTILISVSVPSRNVSSCYVLLCFVTNLHIYDCRTLIHVYLQPLRTGCRLFFFCRLLLSTPPSWCILFQILGLPSDICYICFSVSVRTRTITMIP